MEDAQSYSFDSDMSASSNTDSLCPSRHCRRSSSKSKPPKETFERAQYDGDSCDEWDNECEMVRFSQIGNTVKTKRFRWRISGFLGCDIVKNGEGFLRSENYYVAGMNNQFQFYFLIEAVHNDDDTYFGVYLYVIGASQSEVSVTTKCSIINFKNNKLKLPSANGVRFARRPGFRFLGCISKATYKQFVYMENGDLTLEFRVCGCVKTPQPTIQELKKFAEDGQVRDVILQVNDKNFTASKKLLMEQSPVFARKLKRTKKNRKVIKIRNIEPDVMKQLLIYFNTGRVTKLFKYSQQLLAAAKKYRLKNLKAICKSVTH